MAKLELVDGKIVITQPEFPIGPGPEEIYTPEFPIGPGPEEKKSGIGSLLGGVAGAAKGVGENIATLLGRAGRAGRSSREGVEDRPFKFDATQFMVINLKKRGYNQKYLERVLMETLQCL